ncbi:tetratricopeptide repeat protein, partial [Ralstonia pickettii]
APALEAYQQGQYETAITAAAPFANRHADANRLCALAYSDMRRYPEAFPYWLALFEQEPSAHNALQLATTSVICGELKRGEAWLMKFDEINEQTHEMSSVTARTQFISSLTQSGHMAEALPYLDWLRDVYARVRITDSHFLYVRGIPFFPSFLENTLPVLKASMPNDKIVDWYGTLVGKLDGEGEAQLEQWRQSLAVTAGT